MEVSDVWKWAFDKKDDFSVNCLSKLIDNHLLSCGCSGRVFTWNKWILKNLNIFNWWVKNDRLPHLVNLNKRGIEVNSLHCLLCEDEVEDINQIMFNCNKVKNILVQMLCLVEPSNSIPLLFNNLHG